jgi:hypothetical protein
LGHALAEHDHLRACSIRSHSSPLGSSCIIAFGRARAMTLLVAINFAAGGSVIGLG